MHHLLNAESGVCLVGLTLKINDAAIKHCMAWNATTQKLVDNHSKGKPVLIEAKDKKGRVAPRNAIAKLLCQRGFNDISFDIDDAHEMK